MSLDEYSVRYGVGFGDNVRIRQTPETEELGYAGLLGTVFGETIPSESGVAPIIGEPDADYAVNVYFEKRDEQAWFAPELVAFRDRGAGQELEIAGTKLVKDERGEWHEVGRRRPSIWARWCVGAARRADVGLTSHLETCRNL